MGLVKFGDTKYNKFSYAKFGGDIIDSHTCFFVGHRNAPDSLSPALYEAVERYIAAYGVQEFVAGQYGRFDYLAAEAVLRAKERHPDVRLIYLRPYHPAEHPIETPRGFDGSFYPPGMETVPKHLAIIRANRYMVDHSDYLIAYAYSPGNARTMLELAQTRERKGLIHIKNLADNV